MYNFYFQLRTPLTSDLDKQATSTPTSRPTSTSTINHPRPTSKMATLNQVQLSGSTLTSKIVHKSKLIKCTVIRVTIHNPSISDSVLTNCSIYDCVIHTSKIYNCKIYGDKPLLRCEFEGYELLPSQPTLSKLPVWKFQALLFFFPSIWMSREC